MQMQPDYGMLCRSWHEKGGVQYKHIATQQKLPNCVNIQGHAATIALWVALYQSSCAH